MDFKNVAKNKRFYNAFTFSHFRSGGVELMAQNYKFVVENTLESRLDLMSQQMVPDLRTVLFGRNPNRKFTD